MSLPLCMAADTASADEGLPHSKKLNKHHNCCVHTSACARPRLRCRNRPERAGCVKPAIQCHGRIDGKSFLHSAACGADESALILELTDRYSRQNLPKAPVEASISSRSRKLVALRGWAVLSNCPWLLSAFLCPACLLAALPPPLAARCRKNESFPSPPEL